jgi:hypothetical protein
MLPLVLLLLLFTAADHWTTWRCLGVGTPDWILTEANPVADWLFQSVGLVPGLWLDSAVTLAALAFLIHTRRVPTGWKHAFLWVAIGVTGLAVANNLRALEAAGIALVPTL